MARATLYGAVAQVAVLDSPSYSAALYGAVAQVAVLDSPSYSAALYGAVAQVAVLDSPSYSAALYGAVGQVAVIPPSPVAVLPDISGAPTVLATFDGSGSQFPHYYAWEWTSLPGGSAIANAPIPFPDAGATTPFNMTGNQLLLHFEEASGVTAVEYPDNGANTPIDMTDNEGLYHFESETAGSSTPFPDNGVATPIDMTDNKLLLHFEGNANDTSGNSHNGTVTGATQVAGKVGSFAYSFDGTSDVITVSNDADFARGAGVSFTMAGWVKADAPVGHWEGICYHGSFGGSQGHLGINPSGNLSGGTGDGGNWATVQSSHAVTAGTWMHVAMVVDRSAHTLVLYADGVNVASSAWTAVPGTTTDDLTVGRGYGTGESFDGTIDEFAIWKRALSPTEIATIYDQQSKTGLGISTATAAFTPDIAGTYTVQLTVADGVSVTADAVIAAAGGGRQRRRKGRPRGRGFSVAEINSSLGAGFNSAFD